MAKKAPKSAKKQEAEPASAAKAPKEKAVRKAAPKKATTNNALLSDAFYGKIEQFSQIYEEVNNLIEQGGNSNAFDLSEKERIISEKL